MVSMDVGMSGKGGFEIAKKPTNIKITIQQS